MEETRGRRQMLEEGDSQRIHQTTLVKSKVIFQPRDSHDQHFIT